MQLVADANVLLSAVIGGRAALVLRQEQVEQVFTPAAAYDEVFKYDNETGKGDHRHLGKTETVYAFGGYEKLLADFWADDSWRQRR